MTTFNAQEADFIEYVRRHTSAFDDEWSEIADGSFDIASIVSPLYDRLETDADKAQAMIAAFSSDFVSYVRSRNGDIGKKLAALEALATRSGSRIDEPFFAGRFPTHSFNAQAVREGETVLLLVHTGFDRLMIEAARLLFAIHDKLAPAKVERWPEPSWWSRTNLERLLDNLADLLASFIRDSEPSPEYLDTDEFPFEPEKELPAFTAGMAGQDFAMAHELGHLALGHLRDDGVALRHLRSGLDVLPKHMRDEHEADIFAGRLLLCSPPLTDEQNVLDLIYGKYVGVGLCLDLDGILAEIEGKVFDLPDDQPGQSHPPARMREAVLLTDIRRDIVNPYLFADRRTMGRTFRKIRPFIVSRTLERL